MTPYTLYHGDCLDILPTLEAGSVDAVICDPPYGTTACRWDSVIPFEPMWAGIKRVLKPRGACVLFGSQPFTSALVMSNPKWFKYTWVWDKGKSANFQQANTRPLQKTEDICVFGKFGIAYYPQMTHKDKPLDTRRWCFNKAVMTNEIKHFGSSVDTTKKVYTDNYPSNIIRLSAVMAECNNPVRSHPTQKPLALLEYLVKTYTNEGETVLDFTMGSGTTGHACGNLGRRFIGIEKDAGYYDIAAERIATAYEPLRHMQAAS